MTRNAAAVVACKEIPPDERRVVTIFLFHYGLHTPLPRDPITCMAALTFSPFLCTIMTRPDSFSFSSPTMLDSYGLLVTPTFYQV